MAVTPQENAALVRRFLTHVVAGGDTDAVSAFLAEGVVDIADVVATEEWVAESRSLPDGLGLMQHLGAIPAHRPLTDSTDHQ